MELIRNYFRLAEKGTDIRTELSAGLTTFLTMCYILFVQPQVLAAAGMNAGAVFTATCLSSALACFVMGLAANYPIAQAPLMGENFFFTYTLVLGMGLSWRQALAIIFICGLAFMALNLTKLREKLVNSIPQSLQYGISAGIGLFITLIGFQQGALVVGSPSTMLQLGPVASKPVLITVFGLVVTVMLLARKIKGAIIFGIFSSFTLAMLLGLSSLNGFFSLPPSLSPTFMKMDFSGLLTWHCFSALLIALFMTIFDTLGTLVGVGLQAGLMKDGKMPNVSKAMISDSIATTAGAMLGTSTVSSYIESATGVAAGGRTGLTAITVGALFLLSLFFAPLIQAVGGAVLLGGQSFHPITAPAFIIVGSFMMTSVKNVDWSDLGESLPVFFIICLIPFTCNIADGISFGFILYPLAKAAQGRHKEVPGLLWIVSVLFILRYIFI